MAAPPYLGPPVKDGVTFTTATGGGKGGYGIPLPDGVTFGSRFDKPGRGGPKPPVVTDTPTGGRRMGLVESLAGLVPGANNIPVPPMPSPGQLPGAVSGDQLLGLAPGADQLPGVGGFTSLMDNILGFGGSNPSYESLFGPGGSISSQMGTYDGPNPYANLLNGLFGSVGTDRGGRIYG